MLLLLDNFKEESLKYLWQIFLRFLRFQWRLAGSSNWLVIAWQQIWILQTIQ